MLQREAVKNAHKWFWKVWDACGLSVIKQTQRRTKNSRQRRLVHGDLPLRTPQRGCGKSKPYLNSI